MNDSLMQELKSILEKIDSEARNPTDAEISRLEAIAQELEKTYKITEPS